MIRHATLGRNWGYRRQRWSGRLACGLAFGCAAVLALSTLAEAANATRRKPLSRASDSRNAESRLSEHRTAALERLSAGSAGKDDKAPVHIVVSIGEQRLWAHMADGSVLSAPVSTGQKGFPTPTGMFSILQKNRWHRSNIYSGAPMPFMQRVTWTGIALHAGHLPGYPASHGCIRLPSEFAQKLFGETRLGARVVILPGRVQPIEIEHERLPVPKLGVPAPKLVAVLDDRMKPAAGGAETLADAMPGNAPISAEMAALIEEATRSAVPRAIDTRVFSGATPFIDRSLPMKSGPLSILISRKEQRIYVRQGFDAIYDGYAEVADPDRPIGTHSFTAIEARGDGQPMRWMAISLPGEARPEEIVTGSIGGKGRQRQAARKEPRPAASGPARQSALDALTRITIPPATKARIAELLTPGTSIIVTDGGSGAEVSKGADFAVPAR
jgi:hypothetical protein